MEYVSHLSLMLLFSFMTKRWPQVGIFIPLDKFIGKMSLYSNDLHSNLSPMALNKSCSVNIVSNW